MNPYYIGKMAENCSEYLLAYIYNISLIGSNIPRPPTTTTAGTLNGRFLRDLSFNNKYTSFTNYIENLELL